MRVFGAILTSLGFLATASVVAAAPPPPGGVTRTAYTNATCYVSFVPNPATYPTFSQSVKYKCAGAALCSAQFSSGNYSVTKSQPIMFQYSCSRTGSLGPSTCSGGFDVTAQTYVAEGSKATYWCATNAVTCPSGLGITNIDAATNDATPGSIPKFFYTCVGPGPH